VAYSSYFFFTRFASSHDFLIRNSRRQPPPAIPRQATKLSELLNKPVTFLPDCIAPETQEAVKNAKQGEIFLLENLRFYAEEEGSSKDAEGKKVKGEFDVWVGGLVGKAFC
jgi:3-phosphoglycerate kinase